MELVPYGEADAAVTLALETDPRVKAELGGVLSRSDAMRVHEQRLAGIAEGDWFFTVVGDDGERSGVVGIWRQQWQGTTIHEIGMMFDPAHQGRGLAGRTFAEIVLRARRERAFPRLHAFPGVGNEPSNTVCRRLGFSRIGEEDLDYAGRPIRCAHWVIDLTT